MALFGSQLPIIGVMGGSICNDTQAEAAYRVGAEIADAGAVLLCGGGCGVMEASARGAVEKGGLTIGILPGGDKRSANKHIRIAIATNMGDARNPINILSADLVLAIGGAGGTLSEIALALKNGKRVLGFDTCRPVFSGDKLAKGFVEYDSVDALLEAVRTWCRAASE